MLAHEFRKCTYAIRIHCHMHCVNLADQDVVKCKYNAEFSSFANDVIVFLRNSQAFYNCSEHSNSVGETSNSH